jgi:hypothetical protein
MISDKLSSDSYELKIMAFIDGELPQEEMIEIKRMIDSDKIYREKYNELLKITEVTRAMQLKKLPDMYWDEYWQHIYNRLERGISWILISIGSIIILSFALWNFIRNLLVDQQLNPIFKIGILLLLIGLVILLISIVREKIMVKKVDKYKEVER